VLRLRGKGVPSVNSYGRGDLLVNINVWVPKNLSKEERKVMENLHASQNFKPQPSDAERNIFRRMKDIF
jgi:molecular chaperone DnaJ